MKLRVFRTLWGVLSEADGDKAGSPVLELEDALKEIGSTHFAKIGKKRYYIYYFCLKPNTLD